MLLSESGIDTNWKKTLENHKEMISKIQHERLIHLLVTMFVGSIMILSSFIVIVTKQPELLIISFPLLILFIAYIFHYRFLENTTENWYLLEEEIIKRGGTK